MKDFENFFLKVMSILSLCATNSTLEPLRIFWNIIESFGGLILNLLELFRIA